MAELIQQLLEILIVDTRTKTSVDQPKFNEKLFVIRGEDGGRPAWHFIRVEVDKLEALRKKPKGSNIDVNDYGCIMKYRNEHGRLRDTSGWGHNPPKHLRLWLGDLFGDLAVGENSALTYSEDDIRLCTMKRVTPMQLLGVQQKYWRPTKFHYWTLTDNSRCSLAFRSGMKSYDRVIAYNGVNIEEETLEQFGERFEVDRHLPAQILVCSPATYEHYKSQNHRIHIGLNTVKYFQPVTGIIDECSETILPPMEAEKGDFCAIKWLASKTISVVHQSALKQPVDKICLFETCQVKMSEGYCRGQLIWKGSKKDCEILQTPDQRQKVANPLHTSFEHLANEILMEIFDHVKDINSSFRGLNLRIDDIIDSGNYGSFTIYDWFDPLIPGFSHLLTRLKVQTTKPINFRYFPNLHSLILKESTRAHLEQIKPHLMPKLTRLSLSMPFYCSPSGSSRPIHNSLCQCDANMTDLTFIYDRPWCIADRPQSISIECSHLAALAFVLKQYSKIERLQVKTFTADDPHPADFHCSNFNLREYPLKHLVIDDDDCVLPLSCLDTLLTLFPNVETLKLKLAVVSFIDVAELVTKRLNYLENFRCVLRNGPETDRHIDLDSIRSLHRAFQRIQSKAVESDKMTWWT